MSISVGAAAAIAAGASVASAGGNALATGRMNYKTRQYNRWAMNKQREFALEDREYNSIGQQVARNQAAGINSDITGEALAAQQANTVPDIPSYQHQSPNVLGDLASTFMSTLNSVQQFESLQLDNNLKRLDINNTEQLNSDNNDVLAFDLFMNEYDPNKSEESEAEIEKLLSELGITSESITQSKVESEMTDKAKAKFLKDRFGLRYSPSSAGKIFDRYLYYKTTQDKDVLQRRDTEYINRKYDYGNSKIGYNSEINGNPYFTMTEDEIFRYNAYMGQIQMLIEATIADFQSRYQSKLDPELAAGALNSQNESSIATNDYTSTFYNGLDANLASSAQNAAVGSELYSAVAQEELSKLLLRQVRVLMSRWKIPEDKTGFGMWLENKAFSSLVNALHGAGFEASAMSVVKAAATAASMYYGGAAVKTSRIATEAKVGRQLHNTSRRLKY